MSQSPNLKLPYLDANQNQKTVTHNAALTILDALVNCQVQSAALAAPPASPADGQCWIIASGGTGAWAGKDFNIAAWQDGAWTIYPPTKGMLAYNDATAGLIVWTGSTWVPVASSGGGGSNQFTDIGIGTVPDPTNPLSATLNNALFNALGTGSSGTGDVRVKLNKQAAGNTASFLFQDGFSGRAEIGLMGDDDYRFKTSADGSAWNVSIRARASDGRVSLPQGAFHEATGASISNFMFTPGGDGQISIYRNDAPRGQNPRMSTIASIVSDVITLSGGTDANLFYHVNMAGVSYARIWNTTKSPNSSAWVKAIPATNRLQVTTASDIAGWSPGDTVQIGDPSSLHGGLAVIALDISPMMQAVLGAVFPQTGIVGKISVAGANATLGISNSATSGSFASVNCVNDGAAVSGVVVSSCGVASPISNSNLVYLRETVTAPNLLGVALMSSVALFG